MGRLTTIDDMEKRAAAYETPESRRQIADDGSIASKSSADVRQEPPVRQRFVDATSPAQEQKTQAQQEVDFHGLNDLEKKSSGHIALIAVAVVIVAAAALKIANVF